MSSDNRPSSESRRTFLKEMFGGVMGFVGANYGLDIRPRNNVDQDEKVSAQQSEVDITRVVAEVESMTLQELESVVFEQYPVVPDIESISHRLNEITTIPPNSTLMKTGTSVAIGMLESVFGEAVDQSQINLMAEQNKVEVTLSYLQIPDQALESATMYGIDAPQLLHDPMFCQSTNVMPCPPNTSLIDAYIEHFQPKVAINFVGTNMMRENISLSDFAMNIQELVDHFISRGIIPVLTTLPQPPNDIEEHYAQWFEEPYVLVRGNQDRETVFNEEIEYRKRFRPEHALKYNALLLKIAEAYQIPIINLERGVIESAKGDGFVQPNESFPEPDPLHFSRTINDSPVVLQVPPAGREFVYGEQAVSYFTLQTLYEMVKDQEG